MFMGVKRHFYPSILQSMQRASQCALHSVKRMEISSAKLFLALQRAKSKVATADYRLVAGHSSISNCRGV